MGYCTLMDDQRKRAGVYGRQSHGKAASVEDQDRANVAACERRGWDIIARYSDLVSASRFGTKARNDWPKLTADVAAGKLDVVVMWDTSRGDRTVETWAAFLSRCRDLSVLIHATSHERTYDMRVPRDWRVLMDDGVEAAFESEKKSTDVRRGVAGAALAGKPHGRPAWGYKRVYDENDRRRFTDTPDVNACYPKEIIERVARRDPINEIVRDLTRRGVPTPNWMGVPYVLPTWHRNGLRQVAMRKAYAGLRDHKGRTYPATWPAIVDSEVWRTAQDVLNEPERKTTQPGRYKWLLSYVVAAPCGAVMSAKPERPGHNAMYRCTGDGCTAIGLWELDTFVTELAVRRLSMPDARGVFVPDDEAAALARVEVARVKAELAELAEKVGKGKLSAGFAAAAEPGILARLSDAEANLSGHTRNAALMALIEAKEIGAAWELLSVAGRRSVVDVLFERITVRQSGERLSRWSTAADRVRVAAERTDVVWRNDPRA